MNKLLAIRMVALLLIVGVAATVAALHMIWQQAPIVVLSFHDDAPTWGRAAQAGAAAFVAKSMPAVALLTAVRQIAQKIYVPGKGGVGLFTDRVPLVTTAFRTSIPASQEKQKE